MTLRGRFIPERSLALFLDVDGTLLELAASPDAVRVPAALRNTLQLASQRESGALALVSGRTLHDLDRLFAPSRFPAVGQHGFERRDARGHVTRGGVDHRLLEPVRDRSADIPSASGGTPVPRPGFSSRPSPVSSPGSGSEIRA